MKDVNKRIISVYIVFVIYLIINTIIGFTSFNKIYFCFINPLFLFLISFFIYCLAKENHNRYRNKYLKLKTVTLIMIGYCFLYYLSGLFFSFIDNGYSLGKIITNFISIFLVVIFKEYIRYELVCFNKRKISLLLITILFVLLDINYVLLFDSLNEDIMFFALNTIIPILIMNITSTYLVCKLDYMSNFIYRGTLCVLTIFSPVLPVHNWVINNLFLVGLLIVFIYSVDYLTALDDKRNKKRILKKNSVIYNCSFAIGIIVFMLFVVGAFKYQPIAIMSNSMEDYFSRGDVVVVEHIEQDNVCKLEIGDVIYYKYEDKFITHRILYKSIEKDSCIFNTKGDNNDSVDEWDVEKKDVVGVVKFKIKYVGWPSVLLYEVLS